MRPSALLITGAGGEMGHGLIERLAGTSSRPIVTLDVNPLDTRLSRAVFRTFTGSVLDASLLERILAEFEIDQIFHLAALLSTRAEFTPVSAHHVNVGGTLGLLEFAQKQSESHGRPVVLMYPSSIATYGLPDRETKIDAGAVRERDWNEPVTMYGCNKLYCELLGRYYARRYKQLAADSPVGKVDFRCLRFPGLISAVTEPSGGTSDYAPAMIHAAARRQPYGCFVRADTRMPFMTMPDGIDALLRLALTERAGLTRTVYNVRAFSASAEEIRTRTVTAFPEARIDYRVDEKRQRILDSWPADIDDRAARHDWGFDPHHDFHRAFTDYLIPEIKRRYSAPRTP